MPEDHNPFLDDHAATSVDSSSDGSTLASAPSSSSSFSLSFPSALEIDSSSSSSSSSSSLPPLPPALMSPEEEANYMYVSVIMLAASMFFVFAMVSAHLRRLGRRRSEGSATESSLTSLRCATSDLRP